MTKELLRKHIDTFFTSPAFAVIGVSANRRKFGNAVFRMMKEKEFVVFPVHPTHDTVEGETCYPSVLQVPKEVRSAVIVIPPAQTLSVIEECARKGIAAVWMQPGSDSEAAIRRASDLGLSIVHGECILMFLEPVTSIHSFHRWFRKLVGAYPV